MLPLGILLALCGAASLALAMVTQRYALDPLAGGGDPKRVPLFGKALPRNLVWVIGLVIYGIANGFYALSLLFGPLSLLAGVFTTLLVFNLAFARCLLGERLDRFKVAGAALILAGVVMAVASVPAKGTPTSFTPGNVADLAMRPVGVVYLFALFGIVLVSVVAICWYERQYPTPQGAPPETPPGSPLSPELVRRGHENLHRDDLTPAVVLVVAAAYDDDVDGNSGNSGAARVAESIAESTPAPAAGSVAVPAAAEVPTAAAPLAGPGSPSAAAAAAAASTASVHAAVARAPPSRLDRVMSVVYPGSLGVDEGIAHLFMKASISMLDTCGKAGECDSGVLYVFLVVWVGASVATLWWLRAVFSRYETTKALPVEYGAVNTVSACSGLIFYREHEAMAPWQLALMVAGVVVILTGIGVGNMPPPKETTPATTREFQQERNIELHVS